MARLFESGILYREFARPYPLAVHSNQSIYDNNLFEPGEEEQTFGLVDRAAFQHWHMHKEDRSYLGHVLDNLEPSE